ncbi:MAG: GNAT family N-acetyltransferase [Clostridiales bacterium]|nr:GNAT family N-acetyltransferase [Clostridiales bacterium]
MVKENMIKNLTAKDDKYACALSDKIISESKETDEWYKYFDDFASLLDHPKSLVRNRALHILAVNAQWDEENHFDGIISDYLTHITDEKPITARQCAKALAQVGAAKPQYIPMILSALQNADLSKYKDSMRPLIEKDMAETERILTNFLRKTPRIETNRLLLREIQETDVKDIFDCWMQDEDVSRYMCWKASCDIAETKNFVRFELGQIENEKWYRWIILLKETGKIIGTCLVFYNEDDNESHWDISYNLGKKYWGNGYITEAMKEVMQFAETALGMKECITVYAKVNTSSANVLHKLGFIDEAEIPYEYSGGDMITEGILCRYEKNI